MTLSTTVFSLFGYNKTTSHEDIIDDIGGRKGLVYQYDVEEVESRVGLFFWRAANRSSSSS